MKNLTSIFLLSLIMLFSASSCSKSENKEPLKPEHFNKSVDDYLSSLIKADHIPGLAIVVLKNDKIVHKKYYGVANIAHNVPVSDQTLFRMYSTSKLMTSVAIFQLIERGKIALTDPISKYIENLPEIWQSINIAHLLTCSSGLPEYQNLEQTLSNKALLDTLTKQELHFDKGYTYEYIQTNYWFLQLIIEKVTQQSFEDFVKENQFKDRKDEVLFASNSLVDYPNRVAKYQFNTTYNAYEKTTYEAGNRSLAGNGINVTLNALLDWNIKLDNDLLLKPETKRLMLSEFEYEQNNFPFAYTWGIYGPENKQYHGFAGGGVSALMKFIAQDVTIIILSNGFKNRPVISNAVSYISGTLDERLVRKDRMLNEDMRLAFILNGYQKGVAIYKQTKQNNEDINFERVLHNVGSYYLSNNQIDNAIAIFTLYTQEYPNASNAFNRLGEAYFNNAQYDLAKANYKKSLDLAPNNKRAEKILKKIDDITGNTSNMINKKAPR